MSEPDPTNLDRLFHALSDPGRRGMVDQLSRGPASVKELAEPRAMALPSAVKHLKVLEDGGLVSSSKSGRVRTFELRRGALERMENWVQERKRHLNAQFDQLEAYLLASREADKKASDA